MTATLKFVVYWAVCTFVAGVLLGFLYKSVSPLFAWALGDDTAELTAQDVGTMLFGIAAGLIAAAMVWAVGRALMRSFPKDN